MSLTLFRLLAAPGIALAFLLLPRPMADMAAFVIFVVAAVTDFLDGYLARTLDQMTEIGRVLDPIADKAMVVIALAVLVGAGGLNPWVVLPATVILFREVLVSGLREALGDRATELKVTTLAKWKTTAQMVAIGVLLLAGAVASDTMEWFGIATLFVAAVLTFITGADYAQKAAGVLGERS